MFRKREIVFIILIVVFALGISCSNKQGTKKNDTTTDNSEAYSDIKFDTTFHDFGTLNQGEQASYTFKFHNTGNANLIINDAFSSCGCTIPYFSKEPIAPGKDGKIEVIFNSEGKTGVQYKTVIIETNTIISEKSLMIKANVIIKNYKS